MKALSTLFTVSGYIALLGWLILIAYPWLGQGLNVVFAIVVFLLCSIYAYLICFGKHHDEGQKVHGHFWSLRGVMGLFKSPRAVLAGWVHYLAFDLMVGIYIVSDAARFDISHWLLIPCLILTLLFGPIGLLVYLILRFTITQEYLVAFSI